MEEKDDDEEEERIIADGAERLNSGRDMEEVSGAADRQ